MLCSSALALREGSCRQGGLACRSTAKWLRAKGVELCHVGLPASEVLADELAGGASASEPLADEAAGERPRCRELP